MMPILTWVIQITLGCYAIAMALGLFRIFLGPASQDRILAADFIYNVAMLGVMVGGMYYSSSTYFEVALLISIFGFVSSLAMSKFLLRGEVIE